MSSVSVSVSVVPHGGRLGTKITKITKITKTTKTTKTTRKTMRKLVAQLHAEDVAMQAQLHKVLGWLEAEDALIKARTVKFVSKHGDTL